MRILRQNYMLPIIALGVVGVALALVLAIRSPFMLSSFDPATAPAAEQLQAAASQRPVNKTDQVIWDYQELVRTTPNNLNAYSVLGNAYIQKARETGDPTLYAKAETVFQEALKRDPKDFEALIGKGSLALARHEFREALELGEQARVLAPFVPRVYGVIADAQIELGMYDEAVATIQKMVDMRPDLSSYSRVSYARELYGDLPGAIEAMTMAVNAGGPTAENTEWTRVQLGNLYFNTGDLANAEKQYLASLSRLPDYVPALAGLGRVRAAQGNTAEGVDLLNQAIARMPLPEFVIALGEIQDAAGQQEAAARQYALVRAMQQLFKANGVDTDLELALFDADHGSDPQAAAALARAAYERRPGVKAADTLAWALFKAGQLDEAQHYATEALKLGTKDALVLYHAGMIAQARGDSTAARVHLEQALKINPHFSPLYARQAQQALNQLNAAAG